MGDPSTPPHDLTQRYYGNVMYAPPGEKQQTWPLHNYATTLPFTYASVSTNNYQLVIPLGTDTSDGKLSGMSYASLPPVSRTNPPSGSVINITVAPKGPGVSSASSPA